MKIYFVQGKKWFDKINGNTYCNAKVIDDTGKTMFYIGYQYGYGSFYHHQAKKELANLLGNSEFNLVDLGSDYTLKRIVKNNEF